MVFRGSSNINVYQPPSKNPFKYSYLFISLLSFLCSGPSLTRDYFSPKVQPQILFSLLTRKTFPLFLSFPNTNPPPPPVSRFQLYPITRKRVFWLGSLLLETPFPPSPLWGLEELGGKVEGGRGRPALQRDLFLSITWSSHYLGAHLCQLCPPNETGSAKRQEKPACEVLER